MKYPYEVVKAVAYAIDQGYKSIQPNLLKEVIDQYVEGIRESQYEKLLSQSIVVVREDREDDNLFD